jgi:hypothetical protein
LGVSIAMRKYPVTSRTWKSSSFAAKVVPGELGVRIARCTLHFYKKSPQKCGLFFLLGTNAFGTTDPPSKAPPVSFDSVFSIEDWFLFLSPEYLQTIHPGRNLRELSDGDSFRYRCYPISECASYSGTRNIFFINIICSECG